MSKIVVIGSGFSGLAASALAAKQGYEVEVFEKNDTIGGRARCFEAQGFLFDMGPSWYWMPDAFESFYSEFNKTTSDFYELRKLDPGFQVFFGKGDIISLPASKDELYNLFERIEKGAADKLDKFLKEGEFKYRVGMQKLAHKPALSWSEFASMDVIAGALKTHLFKSIKSYVRSYFKDPRLIAIMEFPVLFLGAKPSNVPALYSLMNYAALDIGTFYPMGGMYKIVEAMKAIGESQGVIYKTNCNVKSLSTKGDKVYAVQTTDDVVETDAVIATGDYHHMEQNLLEPKHRNYNSAYWEKRVLAPSSLIFYLGVSKKIKKLIHHNLFFDKNFDVHASEIYDNPAWPKEPLFYVCCPSKTDATVAPAGMENLFVLIPIAPGLKDTPETHERYYSMVMQRLELECEDKILDYVIYKRSYCVNDFIADYNAYKGNAYGLANTLSQTAVLKPSIKNKRLQNLFYSGQLTVPGPGVPPALISGKISAQLTINYLKQQHYETAI